MSYHRYNIFQIAFVILAGLTFVYYAAFVSFLWKYFFSLFSYVFDPPYGKRRLVFLCVNVLAESEFGNIRDGEERSLVASSNCLHEVWFMTWKSVFWREQSAFLGSLEWLLYSDVFWPKFCYIDSYRVGLIIIRV